MSMNRYFRIDISTKDRQPITDPELFKTVAEAIKDRYDGWNSYFPDSTLYGEGMNWYECDEDMTEISQRFPDLLFEVTCIGDLIDDMWAAGFCDGRSNVQYAAIPPLDYDWLLKGEGRK